MVVLGFSNFPLPSLAAEPPSTQLSFNGHRGASRDLGVDFSEDEPSRRRCRFTIELQHRMTSGAGAREGIHDEIAWVGGDLQNPFDESHRLGCVERSLRAENALDFFAGFVGVTDFFMCP